MILITGATGFLGREIYSKISSSMNPTLKLGQSKGNDIICNLAKEIPVVPNVGVLIHAAGKAHSIPKNEQEITAFFDINVQGTKNLLLSLNNHRSLKKFVFISSVAVYGLTEGIQIEENSTLMATDPYGKSKILAEELIENWCKNHDIAYYILRLPLIAGKNSPGNLGAMVNGIKTGKYASIGKANANKSMVLAEDIANFINQLSGPSGTYNLTDGVHPSFGALEKKIAENFSKKTPFAIPYFVAKCMAIVGDLLCEKFPINSNKLKKITASLTFSDHKARFLLNWNPRSVLAHWIIE